MIDWGKIGPANTPSPSAPSTTAPVAPAAPGTLPTMPGISALQAPPAPEVDKFGRPTNILSDGTLSAEEAAMTKEQVDALGPVGQFGRGVDMLGDFLFGEKSALNNTFFEDLAGGAGSVLGGVGDLAVVKPLEIGADALHAVPLGWLPGGADETFVQIGDWAKANDPLLYAQWQAVDAAAQGNWGAGDLHADFNTEALKYIDDQNHESALGRNPTLAIGRAGVGSLGDAFGDAVGGWLGLLSNEAQGALGSAGVFDFTDSGLGASRTFEEIAADARSTNNETLDSLSEEVKTVIGRLDSGEYTEEEARGWIERLRGEGGFFGAGRSRVESMALRSELGLTLTDIEQQAVDAFTSGAWSEAHANDWLISHGQGISGNPYAQLVGSVLTDPLTAASVGAGAIAKAGTVGARITEAGMAATTAYERAALAVRSVQTSQLGPAFRIARGLIDPLAVYKPSAVARATTDLRNGVALHSFERAYGPQTVADLRSIAREFELGPEIDSAIASYSIDQADLMIAISTQRRLLDEGLGEEMLTGLIGVDDTVRPLSQIAGRDAITELADHMYSTAKNTFDSVDNGILAGRLVATFGSDLGTWGKRIEGMSDDLKSALHAITYKRAEVEYQQARALMDDASYTGDLPLRNMVLMDAQTLDNIDAQQVIDNIRAGLKTEDGIAPATAHWNDMARRYPQLANIGYAPGGKEQLEALVDELEKQLKLGAITRRALPEELSDPVLKPVRDVLDRHSLPGEGALSPDEMDALMRLRRSDAEAALAKAGFAEASTEKFFAAIRKASAVTKSNGRKVGETVYVYPKGEYAKMRRYLSADGKSGFAIKEDGDLVSVFNGGDVKGAIKDIIPHFNALGATKLDAFDEAGRLPELYGRGGFKEVRREAWNPQYAPDGWTGGEPDVVFMEHPGIQAGVNKPLWKLGFRPDEEVAWGLRRDPNTGRALIDRNPTISHTIDAVPGRMHFSDTVRNVLGQTIGRSAAERATKPLTSIEAFTNTMRDSITGRRLVLNIERRFEKTMFAAGVPKPLAKELMSKAREVAGLDLTTIRGIRPDNLWAVVNDLIPRNLVLKDGTHLNIHTVMDHLLQAAEGDLRVMGLTSKLSQRARNRLRQMGDGANIGGQITVTLYNRMRYNLNPTFLIQRITDAPYYSILYGVTPVGKGALTGAKAELEKITQNLARTGMARDFSMDMPEYATRSNFTAGIKSAMQDAGLKDHKLQKIKMAPDVIIANNMVNMLHARLGDIVRGVLDNLHTYADEVADPAMKAEMLAAGEQFQRTFADWRRVYSQNAGRALTDEEVGLQFIKDQMNAWRRHVVREDGTLDFSRLVAEGERSMPNSVGEIGPIRPDILAQELGYADAAALRKDVTGSIQMVGGEPVLVPGSRDIASLEELMRTQLNAHPDYIRRATAYFGETWDDFWRRLSRGVDDGGLDISPHYAKEAQALIANLARERGMDPWEYLSGVMAMNIGAKDLETHIGQLVSFLKSGKSKQPLEEWTKMFRATLDPSAQETLLREFEAAVPVDDLVGSGAATPGAFGTRVPRPGAPEVATLPKGYTTEQGYVYRIETLSTARSGWPKRTGVSVEANPMYVRGDPGEGVFRSKIADADLQTGRHGAGGKDRLTGKATPPEQIEMLDSNGNWVPLGEDPLVRIMSKDFPAAVKERILSGVPHPDPEIEGYMQALSKWVNDAIGAELGSRTRTDLRRLVEAVPTTSATSFNRTQALVVSLLKNKIEDAQQDIFRLAEMQTQRSVLERSLNHPLFGVYPASYMWGKVLPESVKFFARNPYAATYVIADVQRSIAIQREYNPEMEDTMNTVDRSSAAFLLDYMTPGLPWNAHDARLSPLVRRLFEGKPEEIWNAEISTISPDRWINSFTDTITEGMEFWQSLQDQDEAAPLPDLGALTGAPAVPVVEPGTTTQITGPTKAGALAPILTDDLSRLQSILLEGASPEE